MRSADKGIAAWLCIGMTTYYRWRQTGLLPRRPRTEAEAQEMLAKIEAARDTAAFSRLHGKLGRTRLDAIKQAMDGRT